MTQPPPTHTAGDVWAELIDAETSPTLRALYVERRALGIARYGVPLQRGNGRDAVQDLREELLDGMAYATQAGKRGHAVLLRMLLLDL